ncbi:MAG TPA: condensation domain-containing protein, partial [Thermoanaerobaculia bacterium]|nr:condensation domain-containing protein [Thermoanaerobaculia bacterium]
MSEQIKDFGRLSPAKQKLLLRRLKAQLEKTGREPGGGSIPVSPRRQGVKDPLFPLSFAQQRLWFLAQLEPGLPNYHIPTALRLGGPLRVAVLERTLAEVVRRHEALRTTFVTVDDEPFQRVLPRRDDWRLPQADLSGLPDDLREAEARRLATQEARRIFDIENGPHFRATLLRLAADGSEHALLFTLHHIVSDGWSMGVLVEEVRTLYATYAAGQPSPLPRIEVQYPDFADWQRGWLTGEVLDRQVAYWKEHLAGIPAALDLPADHPRPPLQSFRGGHLGIRYSRELLDDLQHVCEREGNTLFMTLLAAFGALLARYTGQDDIPVGSPIANRNRYELEGLIGFFVNTLVLRVELGGDPTFRAIQGRVRETTLGAYAHQDLPFEKLVEELRPERDLSRTPLFQVMFILQNTASRTPGVAGGEAAELSLAPLEFSDPTAKFDLTISAYETPDGLQVGLEYASDLFDEATVRRMLGHFGVLLTGAAADSDRPLSQLPLLTPAEERELLVNDQTTHAAIPDRLVHEQFARVAAERPDAVAVRCG